MSLEVWTPGTEEHLAALASTANNEHRLAYTAAVDALKHAIACGEALIEARSLVEQGRWTAWCKDNLVINQGTIVRHVRLATYRDAIALADDLSVNGALSQLQMLGLKLPHAGGLASKIDVDEARRLAATGMSHRAIAEVFGVSKSSVSTQIDPNAREKAATYQRHKRVRTQAAQKLIDAQERNAAVKRAGGQPAEAYALLRKCAVIIDQIYTKAITNGSDSDMKEALRSALAATHKAEDEIVRALRLGRRFTQT